MKILAYVLYKLLLQYLPSSDSHLVGEICKRARAIAFNMFTGNKGLNINIQRKAIFASDVVLGNNSGIGQNCIVGKSTKIGENVMMGQDVMIYTRNHKSSNVSLPMKQQGFDQVRGVTIGDDVWIGSRVIILPGVIVGNGSILGAGSVISKDVEPYSVVVGNPGRKVKDRRAV